MKKEITYIATKNLWKKSVYHDSVRYSRKFTLGFLLTQELWWTIIMLKM
ncbi:hypothetical protein HMPREF0663_11529 [Hoylesella oralis ATCC 33269]|uniref:Uncharacterized protein n=1 Tax=Hoylesella oralis ATCC 33269 TaxID=873533 RepID=E7RQS8_9BACT|nr:hypothetical protein HMPREF0663_11529 [Hoylesella oralis ATCC 33269]